MVFLRPKALHTLRTSPGKYVVQDDSWAQAKLEVFWKQVAAHVPLGVSANLITVASILPLLPLYVHSCLHPTPLSPCASWLTAVAIFFFQTMDGVDGIHARRCGTTSPLGDFLDHTIDQTCALICVLLSEASMGLGHTPFTLGILSCCSMMAFAVHWETTHTRVLVFENGSSVIEAQLGMIAVVLVAPVLGPQLWDYPVGALMGQPVVLTKHLVGLALMAIPLPTVVKALVRVCKKKGLAPLSQVFPMIIMLGLILLWVTKMAGYSAAIQVVEIIICVQCWFCVALTLLERITSQPLRWYSTLPLLLPGFLIPLLPLVWRGYALVLYPIFAFLSYGLFMADILFTFSKTLRIPLLAQVATVRAA